MIIGCPKEVKIKEFRVGLVPGAVRALKEQGHRILVERGAGLGAGISDEAYKNEGAEVIANAPEVWGKADLIVKVKEPVPSEYEYLRPNLLLYTYLHLAASLELTRVLMEKKVKAVGYETVQTAYGHLPLLRPMSEIAGRIATQVGAHYLQKYAGGKGVLLGGAAGVRPGHVVILGAGTAGTNAARMAMGLGAQVTLLDVSIERLEHVDHLFESRVMTLFSNDRNLEQVLPTCDVLVGAVLIAGAKAPKLVTEAMIKRMEPGSVVVDVSIDQGGCIETIRPTSHEDPVYTVHGVLHYGVTNIPGAVSRTSTFALTNVTFKYLRHIASKGLEQACKEDPALSKGVNTYGGHLCSQPVAEAFNLKFSPLNQLIG
jgi:alanine dehydrogenase